MAHSDGPSAGHDRALVLHGGGAVGNAWEIGVVAGLLDGGIDAVRADLVVGTSAGATAAAQLTAAPTAELLDAILTAPVLPGPLRGGGSADHLARTGRIIAASEGPDDMRRRMGAAALELPASSDPAAQARWRAIVAGRLPSTAWPERTVRLTAVDATTGEPTVFDRDSGVELVDAVAASCSSGFAYRIGDRGYIDGGYRRNENADLAAGHARVLVLSPFGGRTRHPLAWRMQLDAQVEELRAAGSAVETIVPDADALAAFGDDMMDVSRRPDAARAGVAQGRARAADLCDFWD